MPVSPVQPSSGNSWISQTAQWFSNLVPRISRAVSKFFHMISETVASTMRDIRGEQITKTLPVQQHEVPSSTIDALVSTCHDDVQGFVKNFEIWYGDTCATYASIQNTVTKTRVISKEIPQWFKGKTLTKEQEKAILLVLLNGNEQFLHPDVFKAIVAQCTHVRALSEPEKLELMRAVGLTGILTSIDDPKFTPEERKILKARQERYADLMIAFGMEKKVFTQ